MVFLGLIVCSKVPAQAQTKTQQQTQQKLQAQATIRIITLAPHLANLVHAAGAGRHLVGVSEYTPNLYAGALPVIGNAFAFNWQQIAALKPTLVVVWGSGTPASVKAKLKALGLKTFESEPSNLADIVKETRQLATLLGEPATTPELITLQQQFVQLNAVSQTSVSPNSTSKPLRVFHPIWPRPLMTVNGKHVITDALRYCGARNVFASARGLTPTVTLQSVLREKPTVILIAQSSSEVELNTQWQPILDVFPPSFKPTVIKVNGDNFHQPGPSMIPETLKLCESLKAIATVKIAQKR